MNNHFRNTVDLLNLLDEELKDFAREEAQILDEIVRLQRSVAKLRAKMYGRSQMDALDFNLQPDEE